MPQRIVGKQISGPDAMENSHEQGCGSTNTPRKEFSRKTKLAAYMRANGHCEQCGSRLQVGRFRYDHISPDYFSKDNSLENCMVICTIVCDPPKTARDQAIIAKSKRIQDKAIGALKSNRPMPGSRASGWRKRMDGTVERR